MITLGKNIDSHVLEPVNETVLDQLIEDIEDLRLDEKVKKSKVVQVCSQRTS